MFDKAMRALAALALVGGAICVPAMAEEGEFVPDIAELSAGFELTYAPNEEFYLERGGTIEFWAAADWNSAPDYDPVIISNAGPDGASYMIAILRDKSGVGLLSGDREEIAPFDFSDGRFHHIAVTAGDGLVMVYVDGEVCGAFDMTLADLPSAGFFVGSADGAASAFSGAIAGLRIWAAPLEADALIPFAKSDIFKEGDIHPAIDSLVAVSAFDSGELLVVSDIYDEEAIEGEDQ